MKTLRVSVFSLILLLSPLFLTGCWNYREIDEMAIVAGVAVDKGVSSKYKITAEVVQIGKEKDAQIKSKKVILEGNTVFDAVRNAISLSGKRLYWSHSKVVILSEEIAKDGVSKIIDWYNRDAETRADVHILVAKEAFAKEIFTVKGIFEEIISYEIDDMLGNQKSLSKAPEIEIWRFINDLQAKGVGATAPVITLAQADGVKTPSVLGTAIFKKDKLIGYLNQHETKDMLFIKNEVKSGLLILGEKDLKTPVSLEIFSNKTTVEPVVQEGIIEMKINMEVETAIDEIDGNENYIEETGRKKLELAATSKLKADIEETIEKVQAEFGVDIFGFGTILRENEPKTWKLVEDDWENYFKTLKVSVNTKVHIRNSGMMSKPLEIAD